MPPDGFPGFFLKSTKELQGKKTCDRYPLLQEVNDGDAIFKKGASVSSRVNPETTSPVESASKGRKQREFIQAPRPFPSASSFAVSQQYIL